MYPFGFGPNVVGQLVNYRKERIIKLLVMRKHEEILEIHEHSQRA